MRNPRADSQRRTEANARKTEERIERYYGKLALLQTWEESLIGKLGTRAAKFARNGYGQITRLTKTVRRERAYIEHRSGPDADL